MNYPPTKTVPWQHQKNTWAKAKGHAAFYVAHDMGCGKSKLGVDMTNAIATQAPPKVLIICPSKVVPVWPGQFNTHSYLDINVMAPTKGTCRDKSLEIEDYIKRCDSLKIPAVVVLNYEAIIRPPLAPSYDGNSKRIKDKGLLLKYKWDLLICDEAHRIKAPNGRISWQATRIARQAKRRLMLSGTPMPHSPLDIYAQYRALNPNIFGTSFTRFRARYCIMGGFEGRQVIDYQNLTELNQKFYSIADYVEADEVLDLPDKVDRVLTCDLSPKAKRIYNELEREFVAMVDQGIITVNNALDKLLRLAQIANGHLVYEEVTDDIETKATKQSTIIDNSKIELTIETLKDLPPSEPVVIFCRFHNEMDRLKEAIEKSFKGTKENYYKDKRIVSEVSGRVRHMTDFKDGVWLAKESNTLIAQIQAAGEGIDLTAARYNFYFSMGFSLGQYRQSRRRTRRPGQNRRVFYYHIVARGTVDRKILYAIKQKREIVNSVLEQTKHGGMNGSNLNHQAIHNLLNVSN
jgi:SNF2 family DNA or RNA helicase